MKKKVFRILITIFIFLLCIDVFKTTVIYVRNSYAKYCFGDEYNQILYPTSPYDYLIAKKALKEVDNALSTITDFETALENLGYLGYFCVTDEKAVSEKHTLLFVAADFSENTGYIWGEYTTYGYDKNGINTYGGGPILFKLELEKIENEWQVTAVKEAP